MGIKGEEPSEVLAFLGKWCVKTWLLYSFHLLGGGTYIFWPPLLIGGGASCLAGLHKETMLLGCFSTPKGGLPSSCKLIKIYIQINLKTP